MGLLRGLLVRRTESGYRPTATGAPKWGASEAYGREGFELREDGVIAYNKRFAVYGGVASMGGGNTGVGMQLDINEIQRFLPHRYPFLLIDKVVEMERFKRIVAIKSVSINEGFFQGHFPGKPVMPGVLILESMAQAGGLLLLQEIPDRDRKLLYLASMNDVKFRRPVVPGDQLRVEVDILSWKGDRCKIQAKAFVEGNLAAEAMLLCLMVDRERANNAGK
jgi:3-hydroxyacyl-[acyl-carrier-protein] dehydratase